MSKETLEFLRTNVRVGYRLTHTIEVRSEDVERLPRLASGKIDRRALLESEGRSIGS